MFRLLWTISVHNRYYLRRYMPSNRLLERSAGDAASGGASLRCWSPPYLLIASICSGLIDDGGPGWLHLVVLWAIWNAMKFVIMGPVSLALLVRARTQEAVARRRARAEQATHDHSMSQAPVSAGALRRTRRPTPTPPVHP